MSTLTIEIHEQPSNKRICPEELSGNKLDEAIAKTEYLLNDLQSLWMRK